MNRKSQVKGEKDRKMTAVNLSRIRENEANERCGCNNYEKKKNKKNESDMNQ